MNKTILACLVMLVNAMNAQTFEWAKSYGGTLDEESSLTTIDAFGNIYTTGYFYGTVDFDPGVGVTNGTSVGDRDIYIQKIDSAGNFIWVKTFGGISADLSQSIKLDALGNIYITGMFYGTSDFDPGVGVSNLTSFGDADVFVQKLDSSGNFIWAKAFGGTSSDHSYSINVDAGGNVYTTGLFIGTSDFDPNAGTFNLIANGQDVFVHKLDPSGNFLWAKGFGGAVNGDFGKSVNIDVQGNVYVTGQYYGTADFDPNAGVFNLTSLGGNDFFIQKLDPSGNFIWAKSIGGTGNDNAISTCIDVNENICITGSFDGTVDFDPGIGVNNITSVGNNDIFILKMDNLGNFIWAKSVGGISGDDAFSICTDVLGNVYITGPFYNTIDFDPGPSTYNLTSNPTYSDVFILQLDSSGSFLSATSFGGSNAEYANSICVDSFGNIYTSGSFKGTADFDPSVGVANLTSTGQHDFFIQKMGQSGSVAATIIPAAAVTAGAMWNIDGGAWQNSGTILNNINIGTHTINFNAIAGWMTPISQTIIITSNDTTNSIGNYIIVNSCLNNTYPYGAGTPPCLTDPDPWLMIKYQCTSYVTWKVNEFYGVTSLILPLNQYPFHNHKYGTNQAPDCYTGGNYKLSHACYWDDILQSHNINVDNIPAVGAIAHWNPGVNGAPAPPNGVGHVAFVEEVNGNNICLTEYNWNPCVFGTRTINYLTDPNRPEHYIHTEQGGLVSVTNINVDNSMSIYPNPITSKLFVKGIQFSLPFSILNSIGQIIKVGIVFNDEPLNLEQLQDGLYFIKVDNHVFKFSKE